MILAAEATGGIAAIVTAIGGVGVSLVTVYLNSRKQAASTGANTGQIEALTNQIVNLATQVDALKSENATLKLQIQLLEAQKEPRHEEVEETKPRVNRPKKRK